MLSLLMLTILAVEVKGQRIENSGPEFFRKLCPLLSLDERISKGLDKCIDRVVESKKKIFNECYRSHYQVIMEADTLRRMCGENKMLVSIVKKMQLTS